MLKQVVRKLSAWAWQSPPDDYGPKVSSRGAEFILGHLPLAMLVHPISNGYILRIEDDRAGLGEISRAVLVYAKDQQGIADEIIAHCVRQKLNVDPRQGELFGQEIPTNLSLQRAQAMKSAMTAAINPNAQNRSTP